MSSNWKVFNRFAYLSSSFFFFLLLTARTSKVLNANPPTSQAVELMPNIVRHLERQGYPAVVGKTVEVLRMLLSRDEPSLAAAFDKWNGVQRVVAAMSHQHVDVRVACTVFLAQLGKDARWNDAIALSKGYRVLIEMLPSSEDPREQLAALAALRVLLRQSQTNISDFSRAAGFSILFRLIRRQIPASTPVLIQALEVLKLGAANRTVVIEIKASSLEKDVLQHLASSDEALQAKVLDVFATVLDDDAALEFVRKNNNALGTLSAYADMSSGKNQSAAHALIERLK